MRVGFTNSSSNKQANADVVGDDDGIPDLSDLDLEDAQREEDHLRQLDNNGEDELPDRRGFSATNIWRADTHGFHQKWKPGAPCGGGVL